MIIYIARNMTNEFGICKAYIGQTKNTLKHRKKEHIDSAILEGCEYFFHRALRKYGAENFSFDILAHCSSQEEMDNLEKLWTITLRTYDQEFGYNILIGPPKDSFGGVNAGRIHITNGTRNRVILPTEEIPEGWRKGRPSPKVKLVWITNGIENSKISPSSQLPNGWKWGKTGTKHSKPRSIEHRIKISKNLKGKPGRKRSEAENLHLGKVVKAAWAEGKRQGHPQKPETREKIRRSTKSRHENGEFENGRFKKVHSSS